MTGHYHLQGGHEMGSELLLKPDGTFEYMLIYGAADYQAKGAWRRERDAVVLNTAVKDDPPLRLARSASAADTGVRIAVKAPNGAPIAHIEVMLRSATGAEKLRTSSQGVAMFPEAKQPREVYFRVPVYDVQAGPFPLNSAHNDFYFEINGEAITQVRFKDERLRIVGRDLVLGYESQGPMRYERQ